MQNNTIINRTSILSLYRRCIRSIQQIPDYNKRASYLIHVRESFRKRSHLPLNSRDVLLAYRDGVEQVENMEYYHSQMKLKNREMIQRTSSDAAISVEEGDDKDTNKSVADWLTQQLPHLNQNDLTTYSNRLIDDGFDSVSFIEEEMLFEDISFMKKAHRRVIERKIKEWRDGR